MRNSLGWVLLPLALCVLALAAPMRAPSRPVNTFGRYANPLPIELPDGTFMESCPDPSIIHSQTPGDPAWYMYCTNEVFHDHGTLHLMAIARSTDLANWSYVADVFSSVPAFLPRSAGLWAPDIQFFNGRYYLYYASSVTAQGGSAIFVATSDHPAGPFTPLATPVVPPERLSDGTWRDVIDPAIATEGSQRYLFYGSFNGGTVARLLTPDGLSTVAASQQQISPSRRYEASYIVHRQGYYYLFLSAGTCCSGPGSGYGVYVARAPHLLGPYVDKDGISLLAPNVGGTPVLLMNGNRWLGPGHNAIFTDPSGQDWMLYHAVDVAKPTLAGAWTRRPALIDAIDWSTGWPSVRAEAGASDLLGPAPAVSAAAPLLVANPTPPETMGPILSHYSDDFEGRALHAPWTWLHGAPRGLAPLSPGAFVFPTQPGDMNSARHDAPLLAQPAPPGDWIAEVKLTNNLPATGEHNSIQSGLVLYQDDTHFLKLTLQSIGNTRQLEFARLDGPQSWGRAYLAAAAPEIYLRIARHGNIFTAYSSHDGLQWTRGPSWTLTAPQPRIALISAGGAGFVSRFSYVRVGERD